MQTAKRFALPAPAKPAATLAAPVKPSGVALVADTGDAPADASDDLTMAYAMADGLMDTFAIDTAQVSKACRRGLSRERVRVVRERRWTQTSPSAFSQKRGRPKSAHARHPSLAGRCARGGHQAHSRPHRAGQGVCPCAAQQPRPVLQNSRCITLLPGTQSPLSRLPRSPPSSPWSPRRPQPSRAARRWRASRRSPRLGRLRFPRLTVPTRRPRSLARRPHMCAGVVVLCVLDLERSVADSRLPSSTSSPQMLFSQSRRAGLKAEQPDLTFGELGKALGAEWSALDAAGKAPFEAQAAAKKAATPAGTSITPAKRAAGGAKKAKVDGAAKKDTKFTAWMVCLPVRRPGMLLHMLTPFLAGPLFNRCSAPSAGRRSRRRSLITPSATSPRQWRRSGRYVCQSMR
jgi:hypothetical protein